MSHATNADETALVVTGVEVIVTDAPVPGGVDELDLIANHFCNQAYVTNPVATRAVAFEQNQVAGLGFAFGNGLPNVSLGSTGMRQRNSEVLEAKTREARTIETMRCGATGAVAGR